MRLPCVVGQASQKRLVILGRVSEDAASPANGAAPRRDQPRPLQDHAVRIPLCPRFQPQDFTGRGVRCHAADRFIALHANRRLVRAYHCHLSARPPSLFAASVSSRFLNVAPRAHARYGYAEGGEKAARGDQTKRPRERNPSERPLLGRLRKYRQDEYGHALAD